MSPAVWTLLAALCGSAAVGSAAAVLGSSRRGRRVVEAFTARREPGLAGSTPLGSDAHRIQLAFRQIHVNVTGHEMLAARAAQALSAGLTAGLLARLGFPGLVCLGGALLGALGVRRWMTANWNQRRRELERELPAFLAGLSLTIQAVPHWTQAVEIVLGTVTPDGLLHQWLTGLLARVQAQGRTALAELLPEAEAISSALGLLVFELQRLADTGGAGYGEAFVLAAESLGAVLEARAIAASKGESARGGILVVLGAAALTLIMLAGSAAFRTAFTRPVIQLVYLGAAALAAFGVKLMNDLVDDALA